MVIAIILSIWIIWYYRNANKKLDSYTPVTAYVKSAEYSYGRRSRVGGAYRTTVQYQYNGVAYEEQLQYNTQKVCPDETIDCLVDPNNPRKIYPTSARSTNRTRVFLGYSLMAVLLLKYGLNIVQILSST